MGAHAWMSFCAALLAGLAPLNIELLVLLVYESAALLFSPSSPPQILLPRCCF